MKTKNRDKKNEDHNVCPELNPSIGLAKEKLDASGRTGCLSMGPKNDLNSSARDVEDFYSGTGL